MILNINNPATICLMYAKINQEFKPLVTPKTNIFLYFDFALSYEKESQDSKFD